MPPRHRSLSPDSLQTLVLCGERWRSRRKWCHSDDTVRCAKMSLMRSGSDKMSGLTGRDESSRAAPSPTVATAIPSPNCLLWRLMRPYRRTVRDDPIPTAHTLLWNGPAHRQVAPCTEQSGGWVSRALETTMCITSAMVERESAADGW
jgi:hypothetical protein